METTLTSTTTKNVRLDLALDEIPRRRYADTIDDLSIPKRLFFKDFINKTPESTIALCGWLLSENVFRLLSSNGVFINIDSLLLDEAVGFLSTDVEILRGAFHKIQFFSLKSTISMDISIAKVVGSWHTLRELDVSECPIEPNFFKVIAQTCKKLEKLSCQKCSNLDDFELQNIGECISQHRRLTCIDLSRNSDFSDEGILSMTSLGQFIIKSLNLSCCRSLSSLAVAGLRKRMPNLIDLNLSAMLLQQSSFEWIAEGCQHLTVMDLSRSPELDDGALAIIGSKCNAIEKLNISNCPRITDIGVIQFFLQFLGLVKYLDLSGNILCGGPSLVAISSKSSSLETLKMNGLSQVAGQDFLSLWSNAPNLTNFEMAVNLRSTTLHRQSMIPHISDETILHSNCIKLASLKLTGAVLVTDIGAMAISRKCKNLSKLDLSYCMDITDNLLVCLGKYSKELLKLNVTGCGKITDNGVSHLCCGCTKLKHLELSACKKITDKCSKAICCLKQLEFLSLRGCDYLTDTAIIRIAKSCKELKNLDISNLDFITPVAVTAVSSSCRKINSFSCEACAVSSVEFQEATLGRFPCVQPIRMRCRVGIRERPMLEYNKFVASMDVYFQKALILERFRQSIAKTSWLRLYHSVRKQSSIKVQALFRGNKGRVDTVKMMNGMRNADSKAIRLQRAMKRMFGIKYAKDKVGRKRLENASRRLLQRAFRGYSVRIRTRLRFIRLYEVYQKLGLIFYKYWIVANARYLHNRILMVQAHFRGYPIFLSYKIVKNGIVKLQRIVRALRWRKHTVFSAFNYKKLQQLAIFNAATVIKKFIQAIIFNRNVLPFTVFCARYYDNLCNDKDWSALRIQTIYRMHEAMMRVKAIKRLKRRILSGQFKLIILCKGFLARKRLRRTRFVHKALKRFCLQRCRLIVGLPVKIIQRMVRLHNFRMERIVAARTIQRVGRGHVGRNQWRAKMHILKTVAADRIVRYYCRHVARKGRKIIWDRQHMAAWKIQYNVRKRLINNWDSKRRINAGRNARLRREAVKAKADLLTERRIKIVGNIRLRQHHRYARIIQKVYRKYKFDKNKRAEAMKKRKENATKALGELKEIKSRRRWGILPKISRTVNETLRKLRKMVIVEDGIPKEDTQRFTNAILKFQTRSIVQEGIVEFTMTIGETEKISFMKTNSIHKSEDLPYFEMIEGDLSGTLGLGMHIWVRNGHGVNCICTMEVNNKPSISLVALRAREKELRSKGFRLAWNKDVHIELKGECTVLMGKGGFAVKDLKIADNEQEEQRLEKMGFQLIEHLGQYNLPTSLWAHSRQPFADLSYKYGTLTAMDWFDKRMIKCVQSFNLSESDVLGLRVVFEAIQGMQVTYFIPVESVFEYLKFPWIKMCQWVIDGCNPGDEHQISFSEYVQTVCYFCLFGKRELLRFVFGVTDVDQKAYLRQEEFCSLIEALAEGADTNVRKWQLEYKNYSDPKLGYMFYTHFEEFGHNYNLVMWQVEKLHGLFQEKNLGPDFWDQKREYFRTVRNEMGVLMV